MERINYEKQCFDALVDTILARMTPGTDRSDASIFALAIYRVQAEEVPDAHRYIARVEKMSKEAEASGDADRVRFLRGILDLMHAPRCPECKVFLMKEVSDKWTCRCGATRPLDYESPSTL